VDAALIKALPSSYCGGPSDTPGAGTSMNSIRLSGPDVASHTSWSVSSPMMAGAPSVASSTYGLLTLLHHGPRNAVREGSPHSAKIGARWCSSWVGSNLPLCAPTESGDLEHGLDVRDEVTIDECMHSKPGRIGSELDLGRVKSQAPLHIGAWDC
jgi:hypothetical protein